MKIKHQILTYTTLYLLSPLLITLLLINSTSALTQTSATASIRVSNFCSMTANIQPGEEHSTTLIGGQYKEDIGLTTIQTFCNDPNGYAIYAIGYTGEDAGVAAGTNTVLHSTALGSTYDIVTGIATSGDTSNWAMKLASVDGTYKPDILNGYDSYSLVPQSYTKVASYSTNTDLDNPASTRQGSKLTTTYAAYVNTTQPAGPYEGKVKYVLVHPASNLGPGVYYMQNVDKWGGQVAIGQEIAIMDSRDDKSYTVRRMCISGTLDTSGNDIGACSVEDSMLWMTQNLDLDLTRDNLLTSEDTDLNITGSALYMTDYTTDSNGTIYWNPSTTTTKSVVTSDGTFNGWSTNNNIAYSADPDAGNPSSLWYTTGEAYDSDLCYVSNSVLTCNYLNSNNTVAPNYFSYTAFANNGNHGKIGNYYNWPAAVASSNAETISSGKSQNSICPRGWRLPTPTEFNKLNEVYNGGSTSNGYGLIGRPVYMIRSGGISGGFLTYAGYYGGYWSSMPLSDINAHNLGLRSNYVNTKTNFNKSYGWSIRCVSEY